MPRQVHAAARTRLLRRLDAPVTQAEEHPDSSWRPCEFLMSIRAWGGPTCVSVTLMLAVLFPAHARAEDAPAVTASDAKPPPITKEVKAADSGAPPADFVSTKNIDDKLREAKQHRDALVNFGLRDALKRIDESVYRATRIRFAAIYTALYQHASTGDGPRDAAGGDFDLIGTWDAVQRQGRTTGGLKAALEGRYRMETDITPSALSRTIDSLWTTTSGFNRQDFSLVQIYWRQDLLADRLHVRFGKLSGYSTFFGNRINSSSLFFVNYAFADNPAVFFPGNGVGLHATWDVTSRWSVSGGIQDANGVKTELDPSTLRYGEFWFATQAQYEAQIRGLGKGTYRVGSWYVMPRTPVDSGAGGGGVLSIDQELGKKVIGFLRYEYQGGGLLNPENRFKALTGTRSALRGGICIASPISLWPDDYFGVAAAWGDPSDSRAKDSLVGEVFYRFQVEGANQLSLSAQVIESSTIFDRVFVFSVRYRLEL